MTPRQVLGRVNDTRAHTHLHTNTHAYAAHTRTRAPKRKKKNATSHKQCSTDSCVFRMIVDGKVELILAVHVDDIVSVGSDETCRCFHAALVTKLLTK